MKNKKTIEEILHSNVDFGAKNKKVWVSKIVPQIKQLILDEVIGEDEPQYHYWRRWGQMPDDQEGFFKAVKVNGRNKLRGQQRKKLKKL